MENNLNYTYSEEITKQMEDILQKRYTEIINSSRVMSETMRQLALSGIAIAWLFQNISNNGAWFFSIILFIITLLIDLYYYKKRMDIYRKYTSINYFYKEHRPENPKDVWDVVNRIPRDVFPNTERIWRYRFVFTLLGYLVILVIYIFGI